MSQQIVDTAHNGPVLDVAVDSSGQLVATCGEDNSIHLWIGRDGSTPLRSLAGPLQGHEAPVLNVAWASGGQFLASSDESGLVIIWHDSTRQHRQWSVLYRQSLQGVPTALSWAPSEHGPLLAVSLSTGKVTVLQATNNAHQWEATEIDAHQGVASGVSWSPHLPPGVLAALPLTAAQQNQQQQPPHYPQRLATAGSDGAVRVWQYAAADRHWRREELPFTDPTSTSSSQQTPLVWSTIAWAGNIGMPFTYIATGAVEGIVVVWRQDGLDGRWHCIVLPKVFDEAITKVSWSAVGTFLLVSCASGTSTTWKESVTGDWEMLTSMR